LEYRCDVDNGILAIQLSISTVYMSLFI